MDSADLNKIRELCSLKNKAPYKFIPAYLRNKIIDEKITKYISALMDRDIYSLSDFVLTLLNSNPNIWFEQIHNFGEGFMVVRYDETGTIEYISGHKCFIINAKNTTFEIYDKTLLYGIRQTMWISIQINLRSIYESCLKTILYSLST
jgi:hypothetical protein